MVKSCSSLQYPFIWFKQCFLLWQLHNTAAWETKEFFFPFRKNTQRNFYVPDTCVPSSINVSDRQQRNVSVHRQQSPRIIRACNKQEQWQSESEWERMLINFSSFCSEKVAAKSRHSCLHHVTKTTAFTFSGFPWTNLTLLAPGKRLALLVVGESGLLKGQFQNKLLWMWDGVYR